MGTSCYCQNPSGVTNCPEGFFAVCRVRNSQRNGICVPIQQGQTLQQLQNFVLSMVKEERRFPDQFISDDDSALLSSGKYKGHLTNGEEITVTFDMPDDNELLNLGIKVGVFA